LVRERVADILENDNGTKGSRGRKICRVEAVAPATGLDMCKEGGGDGRRAAPGEASDHQYDLGIFGADTTRRSTSTT